MAGWLHGVFVGACWVVSPRGGFSLSLFCNYNDGGDVQIPRPQVSEIMAHSERQPGPGHTSGDRRRSHDAGTPSPSARAAASAHVLRRPNIPFTVVAHRENECTMIVTPRDPNHAPSATAPTHPSDAPMSTPSTTDPTPNTPRGCCWPACRQMQARDRRKAKCSRARPG